MADALTVSLKAHDKFFGRVIETIPPELYKHTVSEDAEGAQEAKYAKVMSHTARKFSSGHCIHMVEFAFFLEPETATHCG